MNSQENGYIYNVYYGWYTFDQYYTFYGSKGIHRNVQTALDHSLIIVTGDERRHIGVARGLS